MDRLEPAWHALKAYPSSDETSAAAPAIRLEGRAVLRQGSLQVSFRLLGASETLAIPERRASARREDGLWEHTCWEAFIGVPGSERYWEVNCSPAGDWNVYRFERYREGMAPESAIATLVTASEATPGARQWDFSLPWSALPGLGAHAELSLTAVLEARDGRRSYWALAHAGARPDFHLRSSFVLRVERPKGETE
ncbi:MAG: DOMON-like domain-containing protein [Oligoflexia bacterium]|nr:DOMON-like domain-containing protein [Oligoflexia bacterium]